MMQTFEIYSYQNHDTAIFINGKNVSNSFISYTIEHDAMDIPRVKLTTSPNIVNIKYDEVPVYIEIEGREYRLVKK